MTLAMSGDNVPEEGVISKRMADYLNKLLNDLLIKEDSSVQKLAKEILDAYLKGGQQAVRFLIRKMIEENVNAGIEKAGD